MTPPSVTTCQVSGCPDLDTIIINGRRRRVCGQAFNRIPGNLPECPTGWLDGGGYLPHSSLEDYREHLEELRYAPAALERAISLLNRLYETFPLGLPRNRADAINQYNRAHGGRDEEAIRTDRIRIRRYHEYLLARVLAREVPA